MQVRRRAIFLVGYMGAGKTSVGRYVAERLRWAFIDLDDRVEARTGRSVDEIFSREGEPAFRRYENEALGTLLGELAGGSPAIVALGGGAFAEQSNAQLLEEFGATVLFLDAPVDELWRRTERAERARPLRTTAEVFRQRCEARRPHYAKATYRVDTSGKSISQVAAEVAWHITMGSTE